MARISDELLEEFQGIAKESGIEFKSRQEAWESANNLVNFFDVLVRIDQEERRRAARLKDEPKGFAVPGEGRTCSLCKNYLDDQDMWYDKWGLKCLHCQEALDKKLIPVYVFKDFDNKEHANASTLSWKLGVYPTTIRKLVRQRKLKARTVPGNGTLVFLRTENPDIVAIIEAEKKAMEQRKIAKAESR
jgi:hypothetical protein